MARNAATTTLHVLLTGDPRVGKSLLLQSHAEFDPDCILSPWLTGTIVTSIYDTAITTKEIGGHQYRVVYTPEPEIRHWFIHVRTHICLMCFSLVDLESYENVRTKWYPALREANKDAPVFLIGTKADLREHNINGTRHGLGCGGADVITNEQALAMQREIGAEHYFESPSSILDEIFSKAISTAIRVADRRWDEAVDKSKSSGSCIVA